MQVTLDEARRIFRERYPSQELIVHDITDGTQAGAIYNRPQNVWTIAFGPDQPADRVGGACRVVCVSKETGKIVCDSWCGCE